MPTAGGAVHGTGMKRAFSPSFSIPTVGPDFGCPKSDNLCTTEDLGHFQKYTSINHARAGSVRSHFHCRMSFLGEKKGWVGRNVELAVKAYSTPPSSQGLKTATRPPGPVSARAGAASRLVSSGETWPHQIRRGLTWPSNEQAGRSHLSFSLGVRV
jgi:hypothetical protein